MEILGEIREPAVIESLLPLMDFVGGQIGMMQLREEHRKNICLAVEEALKNILYHGSFTGDTDVKIAFRLDNLGRFQIVISDYGAPFNMLLSEVLLDGETNQEKDVPPVSTKVMKRVIKDIEYKRIENKNILTFTIPRL
ncbi:MAG: ATP-binding protein [Syntrophorhabdaceae bacterium]|nr:ATP-binding protein [Syntrophorhabdales bacterium]MBP9560638.1 ATP-binding protein [Syntrophorhabdaceae bacterium]